jgi:quercetin dioxygenase-like cupin family protein
MSKFEKGKVFQAREVIDYAEGGVVSKELVHSAAGSITLFSFDAGQGLSEHTAPFDALIQVMDGEMELTVTGVKHVIGTGESFASRRPRPTRCMRPDASRCSSR